MKKFCLVVLMTVLGQAPTAGAQFIMMDCPGARNVVLNHPCERVNVQIPLIDGRWIAPMRAGVCCDEGRAEVCFYRWLPDAVDVTDGFRGFYQSPLFPIALYYARRQDQSPPIVQVVAIDESNNQVLSECAIEMGTLIGFHSSSEPCALEFDDPSAGGTLKLRERIALNYRTGEGVCLTQYRVIDLTAECPCNTSRPPTLIPAGQPTNEVTFDSGEKSRLVVAYYRSCDAHYPPRDPSGWQDICKFDPYHCRALSKLFATERNMKGDRVKLDGEALIIADPCRTLLGKNGCPNCPGAESGGCLTSIQFSDLDGYLALVVDLNRRIVIAGGTEVGNGKTVISVPSAYLEQFGGLENLALMITPAVEKPPKNHEVQISVSIE